MYDVLRLNVEAIAVQVSIMYYYYLFDQTRAHSFDLGQDSTLVQYHRAFVFVFFVLLRLLSD